LSALAASLTIIHDSKTPLIGLRGLSRKLEEVLMSSSAKDKGLSETDCFLLYYGGFAG